MAAALLPVVVPKAPEFLAAGFHYQENPSRLCRVRSFSDVQAQSFGVGQVGCCPYLGGGSCVSELVYGFRYTSNHRIQPDVLLQRQAQKSPQGLRRAGS